MSHRGRGGEEEEVGSTPVREIASAPSGVPEINRPGTGATSVGTASVALGETSTVPLTPTTTTGIESEHSSEHGRNEGDTALQQPRQVIAVSVSKGPSAFFNLARKFLVTDEVCDLSALEGAIVSAVDAAHLLERSKIATIISIQTSYVTVEPKKRKDQGHSVSFSEETGRLPQVRPGQSRALDTLAVAAEAGRAKLDQSTVATATSSISSPGKSKGSAGALRRSRIVITVRRTEAYKKWLDENPIQDIISGEDEDRI